MEIPKEQTNIYRCPYRKTCLSYGCCHHFKNAHTFNPVHEPCDWYIKHLEKMIRKEKIDKINESSR